MKKFLTFLAFVGMTAPLSAQDLEGQEIIVTATRVDQDSYFDTMPAVGLRRKADFLVQEVTIRGDTRDAEQREREICAMLAKAIEQSSRSGVDLALGSYILTRLTPQNAGELDLKDDRRPDSQRIDFLVKTPLTDATVEEAQARIRRFVETVPEVGRAQMDSNDDATLSVVGPDSYRDEIIAAVAEDARKQAAVIGAGYAVELLGLNMPVQWARSGPGEVMLFIPYELRITPRP